VATPGGDLPGDPAIQLVLVANGLTQPVNVTNAGDGSGRIFVVERVGRIRVIENGTLLDQPFLDISGWVTREDVEQGLLGLAFDPDYATNGFFYLYYTDYWRNGQARVSRFQISKDDPNHAEMNSVQPVLAVDEPYTTHNAGEMHFGPDGALYIALGDGGFGFYPYEKAPPSLDNLLGKILRIDVHAPGDAPYTVPTDNPFVGQPGVRPETWVYGLRNPWQFAFDRVTGDLYYRRCRRQCLGGDRHDPRGEQGREPWLGSDRGLGVLPRAEEHLRCGWGAAGGRVSAWR